jgi:hypothetical protein
VAVNPVKLPFQRVSRAFALKYTGGSVELNVQRYLVTALRITGGVLGLVRCTGLIFSVAEKQLDILSNCKLLDAVELHSPGLIGTARHPDMQKIQIIGFSFENRLHWQFAVRLLLFTVCTCV